MTKTTHVSVRIRPDLSDKIELLAGILDRPKSWVIEKALEEYIAVQEWQIRTIQEGLVEADAGKLVSHDAVKQWAQSWGQPKEKPRPRSS